MLFKSQKQVPLAESSGRTTLPLPFMARAISALFPFGGIGLKPFPMHTPLTPRRQSQGAVDAPSVSVNTMNNGFTGQSCSFTPFVDTQSLIKSGQQTIIGLIACLRYWQRPFYIANLVMPVIVDAVDRVLFGRSTTYLFQKVRIRLKPKFNTTSAIVSISPIFRVVTSLTGPYIGRIFWRISQMDRFPVQKKWVFCSSIIISHCSKDNSFMNLVRGLRGLNNLSSPV